MPTLSVSLAYSSPGLTTKLAAWFERLCARRGLKFSVDPCNFFVLAASNIGGLVGPSPTPSPDGQWELCVSQGVVIRPLRAEDSILVDRTWKYR